MTQEENTNAWVINSSLPTDAGMVEIHTMSNELLVFNSSIVINIGKTISLIIIITVSILIASEKIKELGNQVKSHCATDWLHGDQALVESSVRVTKFTVNSIYTSIQGLNRHSFKSLRKNIILHSFFPWMFHYLSFLSSYQLYYICLNIKLIKIHLEFSFMTVTVHITSYFE